MRRATPRRTPPPPVPVAPPKPPAPVAPVRRTRARVNPEEVRHDAWHLCVPTLTPPGRRQTLYESAVERTLQGVRSRSSFASRALATPKGKGRGKEEGPARREPSNSSPLLTAADEVELAKMIQDLLLLERTQTSLEFKLHRTPTPEEWACAVGMDVNSFKVRSPKRAAPSRECLG